jgi:hypothetical protein
MITVYIDSKFSDNYIKIIQFLEANNEIKICDNYRECDYIFSYEKQSIIKNGYANIPGKFLSKHNIWKILDNKYCFTTLLDPQNITLNGLWIEKPIGGSCAKGISVIKNPENWNKKDFILQKYLENPLLYQIDNNYHKFDIRMYVCLKRNGFYMFPDGLIRIAQKEFDINNLEKETHVTNISIMKQNIEKFAKIISKQNIVDYNMVINKCYEVCCYFFGKILNTNSKKNSETNRFIICGLDIILDSNYNPYLIECNSKPNMDYNLNYLQKFLSIVTDGLMSYAMNLDSEHINKDFIYNYC